MPELHVLLPRPKQHHLIPRNRRNHPKGLRVRQLDPLPDPC